MTENGRQSLSGARVTELLGPKAVLEIQQQGHAAAVSGEHVTTCPWKAPADDTDQARRDMWVRGYAAGRTTLRELREVREPG